MDVNIGQMWSWATWKHGIRNLAEHIGYSIKAACKNNLVLQHGLNESLCSGQGLKLVTTSWKCAFLKKVFEKCCNVSPTILEEGKGAENTKEKSRQCFMAIMSFCRLPELGKISRGNIS